MLDLIKKRNSASQDNLLRILSRGSAIDFGSVEPNCHKENRTQPAKTIERI